MASATQSQKRSKSGSFIKGGELNRRKLCAEKFRVVSQQCSEDEKEPVNTMCEGSEHEVSWDYGRLGMLAEGLASCCFCQHPIRWRKKIWASKLTLHPSCLPHFCDSAFRFCWSISYQFVIRVVTSKLRYIPLLLRHVAQQRDFKIRRQFNRNLLSKMVGDPYFSSQKHILFTIVSILSKYEQKITVGSFKNFKFSVHETSNPACGCKVRDTMVAKCELVL